VYTGVVKKIAEHGGEAAADRDVAPRRVRSPRHSSRRQRRARAGHLHHPNDPGLLGVNPNALQAVRIEHTPELPDL